MREKMTPIIQSLWIGSDLSNLEKLCVQSFLDHGHEFHLYTYADIGGVPDGAMAKDANEILPESEIYAPKRGGIAAYSDYFRYNLLARKGNFWVDMDTVCIKPFDFHEEFVFSGTHIVNINTTPIKCPQGHPFAVQMAQVKTKSMRDAGPLLLDAIAEFNLQGHCKPPTYFNPVSKESVFDKTFSGGINLYKETHAIHLCNSGVSKMPGFDKNAIFDKESLVEQLKQKHGITSPKNAITISSTQIAGMSTAVDRAHKQHTNTRRKKQKIYWSVLIFCIGVGVGILIG